MSEKGTSRRRRLDVPDEKDLIGAGNRHARRKKRLGKLGRFAPLLMAPKQISLGEMLVLRLMAHLLCKSRDFYDESGLLRYSRHRKTPSLISYVAGEFEGRPFCQPFRTARCEPHATLSAVSFRRRHLEDPAVSVVSPTTTNMQDHRLRRPGRRKFSHFIAESFPHSVASLRRA